MIEVCIGSRSAWYFDGLLSVCNVWGAIMFNRRDLRAMLDAAYYDGIGIASSSHVNHRVTCCVTFSHTHNGVFRSN